MAYNPQQIMSDIQGQNLNNMRNLIIKANNDPRSLTKEQIQMALQFGQQLGIDMSPAMQKDKASFIENVGAGVGGAIDSTLFGIIPDNWYSSYRTKGAKNVGKIAGTVGSFFIPGYGIFNATKGAKGIANTAKALFGATGNVAKSMSGAKTAKEALSLAQVGGKELFNVGKTALMKSFEGMTKAQIAKEMAKIMIRSNQLIGTVPKALYPSTDTSQLNPYTQEMGISGMPQMP